jgi:choline dehydrogenase
MRPFTFQVMGMNTCPAVPPTSQPNHSMRNVSAMDKFDYVIVGASPAGCVLAHRLSEDASKRVLLLEGGPSDNHPMIHMPKGVGKLRNDSRYMLWYDVYEDEHSTKPLLQWMRGRTLGGSSSINGMVYVRGQPRDYEDLAALTSEDWNWKHMAAAFKAIEDHNLAPTPSRGKGGPLKVTTYPGDGGEETLMKAAIAAGEALGLGYQEDINEPDHQAKICHTVRTIHRGRRQSAAVAFLRPAEKRRNLVIRTGVLADRVIFEGMRAVAVECQVAGETTTFFGSKIILCAGALSSPTILQRSGVGSPVLLARHGIPLVAASPEVGENMIEHTIINLQWRAKGYSNNPRYQGIGAILSGARYYLTRSGPLANAVLEVTGHCKTDPSGDRPDTQIHFGPHSFKDSAQKNRSPENEPGFMMTSFPLRPRSKGKVRIESKDPAVLPRVIFNPFADPDDRRELIAGVRFIRQLAATPPLSDYVVQETRPGPQVQTDEEILGAIRRWGGPGFHAAGTCRMGADDKSVVDPQTRVRGVQNLHVVDLSISPILTSGNTYGPVVAMAWRAADLIIAQDRQQALAA